FRYIAARGIFFDHASHTTRGRACTNGLLHDGRPFVRNVIGAAIIVGWNNFLFKQAVQRQAIRFSLYVRVMIFTLSTDGPAILAVVALGPPALKDAAISLSIESGLLTAGAT